MAHIMTVFKLPPQKMRDHGDLYSVMFFLMGFVALLIYFVTAFIANSAAQAMNYTFRQNLLNNILRQDIEFFDRPENTVGALIGRLDSTAQVICCLPCPLSHLTDFTRL